MAVNSESQGSSRLLGYMMGECSAFNRTFIPQVLKCKEVLDNIKAKRGGESKMLYSGYDTAIAVMISQRLHVC